MVAELLTEERRPDEQLVLERVSGNDGSAFERKCLNKPGTVRR
jgi:hypothetical protein